MNRQQPENRFSSPPVSFPAPLAPFASRASHTRGRVHAEPESPTRTPFQRDRDRIVHSAAFRRLKHKTQVFVAYEGDHYRTRLTHSLEVAQIARSLARSLKLDEDLAEGIALAHDIGHPPFGHAGEDMLHTCMASCGGFDHNVQTFRLLTALERRHPGFDGLNLTFEMLEGLLKHNGPLTGKAAVKQSGVPRIIEEFSDRHGLRLDTFASMEAQVAAIADDIAYNSHDIDDGLRAGLFSPEQVHALPLAGEALAAVTRRFPRAGRDVVIAGAVSEMTGMMIAAVLSETRRRLSLSEPVSGDAVRLADMPMVAFPEETAKAVDAVRDFLYRNMYRHGKVCRVRREAGKIVRSLFGIFRESPERLPSGWHARFDAAGGDAARRSRVVCDYIAGMTDGYACHVYCRLAGDSVSFFPGTGIVPPVP